MKKRPVPVLITWDVDPDRWATVEHREKALTRALDLCEEFQIRSTFFITAQYAHEYPSHIERMKRLGQEIACHGLKHTDEEDYDRMPVEMQQAYLTGATNALQQMTGLPVRSFRSPRVKTSGSTLRMLSEMGYMADSTVCSQRVDFISSNLINLGWILAPRLPYHPGEKNPYKPGTLPIWEVPVTAAVLPLISSVLKVVGVHAMKAFIWLLYQEARVTGKPVVYLSHPTEMVDVMGPKIKITLADFSLARIRTHGLLARNLLFRLMGDRLFIATRSIFHYLSALPGVCFMTCSEYACLINEPLSS